jgi:hypothetical protein
MARFGYAAVSARRYISYTPAVIPILMDESQRAYYAQSLECSPQEVVDHLAAFYRFVLGLGEEARNLLEDIQ